MLSTNSHHVDYSRMCGVNRAGNVYEEVASELSTNDGSVLLEAAPAGASCSWGADGPLAHPILAVDGSSNRSARKYKAARVLCIWGVAKRCGSSPYRTAHDPASSPERRRHRSWLGASRRLATAAKRHGRGEDSRRVCEWHCEGRKRGGCSKIHWTDRAGRQYDRDLHRSHRGGWFLAVAGLGAGSAGRGVKGA
jgi:hypothetical protein